MNAKYERQVTASYQHTCAIKTDSTLLCWGIHTAGPLGFGQRRARPPIANRAVTDEAIHRN